MATTSERVRVGSNLPYDPQPEAIRANLWSFAEAGYDVAEVSLDLVLPVIGGELALRYVEYLRSLLEPFPLAYSAHIGAAIDLRAPDHELHRKALYASIEACARLGASPLVLPAPNRTPTTFGRSDQAS